MLPHAPATSGVTPTQVPCEAVIGWRIQEGHYGNTRLDGLNVVCTSAFPAMPFKAAGPPASISTSAPTNSKWRRWGASSPGGWRLTVRPELLNRESIRAQAGSKTYLPGDIRRSGCPIPCRGSRLSNPRSTAAACVVLATAFAPVAAFETLPSSANTHGLPWMICSNAGAGGFGRRPVSSIRTLISRSSRLPLRFDSLARLSGVPRRSSSTVPTTPAFCSSAKKVERTAGARGGLANLPRRQIDAW